MTDQVHPRIGVGMIIRRTDGRILMQQRFGAHGEGTWGCPGGHLEFGESFEQCGMREAAEEAGVLVKNVRVVGVTNDMFAEEGKHYATVWVIGEHAGGEARIMEPEKMTKVEWVLPDMLPMPLFLPFMNFLRQGVDLKRI